MSYHLTEWNTTAWERDIDRLVYDLYNLTIAEIALLEKLGIAPEKKSPSLSVETPFSEVNENFSKDLCN